ncbi:hypothetical protein HNY73_000564 [Argiope bruennichi]|uniref:Uncharacterized protein n=1 Tax=Argiope bruennichi TaxID=94029 RepID=A0A8T0G294_ARGBR|nr:hypothetical protein HNY73_000564 [Argiope bruennichi]
MADLVKTIAISSVFCILCAFSAISVDPESFKQDVKAKLNLQEETLALKYYHSFKDYMRYILQSIYSMKSKAIGGIDYIIDLYGKLTSTYWFQCIQGYFVTGFPQPIKEVVRDVKDSEAVEDAQDFIRVWIWKPIRNINVTEIQLSLKRNLRRLQESDAFRRPHKFLVCCIVDVVRRTANYCCNDALLSGKEICEQQWSEMPLVQKFQWFVSGFAACFMITYIYNYIKELREEFNTFEEFLEAVEERKYPLDEMNKKSHKHSNLFTEDGTTDEE